MSSPSAAPGRSGTAAFILFLAIAAFAILVRFLSIAQPLGIDQSLWASAVRGMARGQRLYLDVWEQRPPGIYLTYWAAFSVLGWKVSTVAVLDVLAATLTTTALFVVARSLGGRLQGSLTAALYAVLTMPAALYGRGGFLERSVSETFIVNCIALAAICAIAYRRRQTLAAAAGLGLFAGAAIVFKPNAGIYAPALFLWALLPSLGLGLEPRRWIRPLVAAVAASLVIPAAVLLWLASIGALAEAKIAIVDFNRWYVAAGFTLTDYVTTFSKAIGLRLKTEPLWVGGLIGCVVALTDAVRRRASPAATLALWWGGAGALVIVVNGIRLYNSYFVQVLPPLALAAGWWLAEMWRTSTPRRLVALSTAVLMTLVLGRTHYLSRVIEDAANDAGLLRGRTSETDYLDRFGGYDNRRGYSARANIEVARYLQAHTAPDDRIFVFGINGAGVYFLADRLTAQRFLRVNFFVPPGFPDRRFTLESVTNELKERRPQFLVFERLHSTADPAVAAAVDTLTDQPAVRALLADYVLETRIEDFTIYGRRH